MLTEPIPHSSPRSPMDEANRSRITRRASMPTRLRTLSIEDDVHTATAPSSNNQSGSPQLLRESLSRRTPPRNAMQDGETHTTPSRDTQIQVSSPRARVSFQLNKTLTQNHTSFSKMRVLEGSSEFDGKDVSNLQGQGLLPSATFVTTPPSTHREPLGFPSVGSDIRRSSKTELPLHPQPLFSIPVLPRTDPGPRRRVLYALPYRDDVFEDSISPINLDPLCSPIRLSGNAQSTDKEVSDNSSGLSHDNEPGALSSSATNLFHDKLIAGSAQYNPKDCVSPQIFTECMRELGDRVLGGLHAMAEQLVVLEQRAGTVDHLHTELRALRAEVKAVHAQVARCAYGFTESY